MCIRSDELVGLVERTRLGALLPEQMRLAAVGEAIRRTNATALQQNPGSRFLRNIVRAHLHFFTDEAAALLQATELLCLEWSVIDAFPRVQSGRRFVIVFDGLLKAVRYYADLTWVLELMRQSRPDATLTLDGS
jgi:hypothetical protein